MSLSDVTKKLKDKTRKIAEDTKDKSIKTGLLNEKSLSKMNDASDKGSKKTQEIVQELAKSNKLFEEAGYSLTGISVGLSIPPKISTKFKYEKDIPEEKEKELLKKVKGDTLMTVLLTALFKAASQESSLEMGDLQMESVSIDLGLIPSITINLERE